MKFHPLADEYDLDQALIERMIERLKEHGYDSRFPIILYKGRILDGRHRWLACKKLKIKPPVKQFKGTDAQAAAFVQTANEERRHLSQEWLEKKRAERIGRVVAARREGQSLRAIAEAEDVSLGTVQRDIEAATVSGDTVDPPDGKITGQDGRQRPAVRATILCSRCTRLGAVKDCSACKAERQAVKTGRTEPGTHAPRPSAGKAKGGKPGYDWRPFHDGFGMLMRQIDNLGGLYGVKESGDAERLRSQLSEWKRQFTDWHNTTTRTTAPAA